MVTYAALFFRCSHIDPCIILIEDDQLATQIKDSAPELEYQESADYVIKCTFRHFVVIF